MRSGSTRALAIALLLTLAAPAPRMTAWLLGSAATTVFAPGRHEPQARGRNRLPSPARAAVADARVGLASGGGSAVRSPGPSRDRLAPPSIRRPARHVALLTATSTGSTRLRC